VNLVTTLVLSNPITPLQLQKQKSNPEQLKLKNQIGGLLKLKIR
jgi:hypothetical protein